MTRASLALLVLLVPATGAGQSVFPGRSYWTHGSLFLENQPTAHLAGGMAGDLLVRGPWITKSWRNRPWKRVAWTGVFGFGWQFFLSREDPAHSWRDGAWDIGFNMVGAGLVELLVRR
jgi:hypothetical protein